MQVLAKGAAQVLALERELDGGLQEAELVAGVVAHALELVAVERPALLQLPQAVRQLDLAPAPRGVLSSSSKMAGVRM